MPLALSALAMPGLVPVEAALILALAGGFALMAAHGPARLPPPDAMTSEAVFAAYGWM
jgi:hypothetical protein